MLLLGAIGLLFYSTWYQWKGHQETANERMKSHRPIAEFNHGNRVRTLAISPSDPHYIVSAGEGYDIKVWNRDNPEKPYKVLTNHPIDENDSSNRILSVYFSSSGELLISKNFWMLAFWDVSTMELISSYRIPSGIGAVSPSENLLATESEFLEIWDFKYPKNLKKVYTLAHKDYDSLNVSAMFSFDGKWFAKGGTFNNTSVLIWNLNTKQLHKVLGRESTIESKSNPNEKQPVMVVSNQGQGIKEYYTNVGNDDISTISFSPDNRFFVIGSNYGFTIWSIPDWKIYHDINNVYTLDIAFSPNGSVFAVASINGIMIWSIDEMKPIAVLKGNSNLTYYNNIVFSQDGKLLVGSGHDVMLNLWDLETIE